MKHILITTIAAVVLVGCVTIVTPRLLSFDAIKKGDIETVKQQLDAGADVNASIPLGYGVFSLMTDALIASTGASASASGGGKTAIPLHVAAEYGRKEVAELLIANGAYVNTTDDYGWTTLHQASRYGHKEIVELLLAKGAYVNAKGRGGTPLGWASREGHKEITELLIAKGADVNAKTDDGRTPLHSAAYWGRKEVAALLIGKGADVNAKDKTGFTPLGGAIRRKHTETANLLRKHGGKTGEELKAEGK